MAPRTKTAVTGKDAYIKSLNAQTKPAVRGNDRRLRMTQAELIVMLDQSEEGRRTLQSENQVLRGELDTIKASDESKYTQIVEKLNGLVSAFTFHMDTNTMAINALSANVANLMAKRQ